LKTSGKIPIAASRHARTSFTRRWSHRVVASSVTGSAPSLAVSGGRTASAAAVTVAAVSYAATAASASSSVPGKRDDRKSGNKLIVVRAVGQYHRAIKSHTGCFRA